MTLYITGLSAKVSVREVYYMIKIIPENLSESYRVTCADETAFERLFALYSSNKSYFDHFSILLSEEQLIRDMTMLPDCCMKEQKFFLAYYDRERLTAIMDLISGYPEEKTCYIGLFMVDAALHGRGIGTDIITELCASLNKLGCEKLRLCYGKRYPSAKGFWMKNAFLPLKEVFHEEYGELIVAERRL